MGFSEFGLKGCLLKGLEDMGYVDPTPIQEQVLRLALAGKNIVGQSQTGTGKTAAFLLPILHAIDTNDKSTQALILAPTRELVVQIGDEIAELSHFCGIGHVCLYGGASPVVQKKNLLKKPPIIVATPGRLMDFMNQKVVDITTVRYFVLDEVDRMLDMGFVRDIKKIRAQMKKLEQTYTFSATMNHDMKAIIKDHIAEFESIKISNEVTVDAIDHSYVVVDHEQKLYNLINLIKVHSDEKIIVFTHTKRNTKIIREVLLHVGLDASMMNGNMSQGRRMGTLNDFRSGKVQVLVTTDVAARGLNMENIGLVINFDVPIDAKSYIHRIGRTGRAGATGKAIMLVSSLEKPLLEEIEKVHKIRVRPSDYEVVLDPSGLYTSTRLNRSTDKLGGKRQSGKGKGERARGQGVRAHTQRSVGRRSDKVQDAGFKTQERGDKSGDGGAKKYVARSETKGMRTYARGSRYDARGQDTREKTLATGRQAQESRPNRGGTRSSDSRGTRSSDSRGTRSSDSRGTRSSDSRGTRSSDSRGTRSSDSRGTRSSDSRGTRRFGDAKGRSTNTKLQGRRIQFKGIGRNSSRSR